MYTVFVLQLLIYIFPACAYLICLSPPTHLGVTTDNVVPVFSTLRVYALTAQNKLLALITLFFSLGPLYANAVCPITTSAPRYIHRL